MTSAYYIGIFDIKHSSTNTFFINSLQLPIENLKATCIELKIGISGDFLAMDIRHVLNYLGEISGKISMNYLLRNIFSSFFVGK